MECAARTALDLVRETARAAAEGIAKVEAPLVALARQLAMTTYRGSEEFAKRFDAAIDYKGADVRRALREEAPGRVDVFFDNVGGDILDAVLTRLARGARIVICGGVSQYNAERMRGPASRCFT